MRHELRRRGVKKLCVVSSYEEPIKVITDLEGLETKGNSGRLSPGSSPFVPPAAGLMIASKVCRDLIGRK
jgi:tRNA A37 threonylcarbamoyladenosine dehydratase